MPYRSNRFRAVAACGAAAALLISLSPPAYATDPATPAADAAPTAAQPSGAVPATISSASCENLELSVSWKGDGVNAVDYYSAGETFLQARKDPAPTQSSVQIHLGKEWEGRRIEVRLFDSAAKLLDTKPVECSKAVQ